MPSYYEWFLEYVMVLTRIGILRLHNYVLLQDYALYL